MLGVIADFLDVVHQNRPRAGVDVIANVVQRDDQRKNIFAVKRRDKRFVEFGRDFMRQFVAVVFGVFDVFEYDSKFPLVSCIISTSVSAPS